MWDLVLKIDWYQLFVPSVSLVELFIRGTVVYLVLFSIMRFLPGRQLGGIGLTDLLVVVLFASASENAMAKDYSSLTDGFMLVGTIIFWSSALNWLGFQFPWVQRIITPPPLPLIKDGRIIGPNMRRELITKEELMSQLRQQGIGDMNEVKRAFMETGGQISVVTYDPPAKPNPRRNRQLS